MIAEAFDALSVPASIEPDGRKPRYFRPRSLYRRTAKPEFDKIPEEISGRLTIANKESACAK
jgi:hypothetical protein